MQCHSRFWAGVAVGATMGAAALRLLQRADGGPRENGAAKTTLSLEASLPETGAARPAQVHLKREDGAGDPLLLVSARTGVTASFQRPGGAPGGREEPEWLDQPGQPGRRMNHRDISTPVQPASRTLPLHAHRKQSPAGSEE